MRTRTQKILAGLTVLLLSALSADAAAASDSVIMLRVDVSHGDEDSPKVKVTLPLSLIEVVIENVDTSRILSEMKNDKGIDLAKLYREIRKADVDEFITIDEEDAKVRVFKDKKSFRVTIQETGEDSPNVEAQIPFAIMDYLFEQDRKEFKFSELVESLRGHLPLTIVEAKHDGDNVKVWLEEK